MDAAGSHALYFSLRTNQHPPLAKWTGWWCDRIYLPYTAVPCRDRYVARLLQLDQKSATQPHFSLPALRPLPLSPARLQQPGPIWSSPATRCSPSEVLAGGGVYGELEKMKPGTGKLLASQTWWAKTERRAWGRRGTVRNVVHLIWTGSPVSYKHTRVESFPY
jgi:hypothetical protein